jgi:hypothetical protein
LKLFQVVVFTSASCAFAAPAADPREARTELLPRPRAALEFPQDAREVTLGWMVDELGRLTGQELTMAPDVREALDSAKEPIEIRTPVPVGEVYAFVESMLLQREFYVAPVKGGERPVLAVIGFTGRAMPAPQRFVPAVTDIEGLADHPALLCQIVLTFENIDTRQLQTQLRQLLVDQTNLMQVVPAGERCLVLQGPGGYLLGLARLLEQVDRASAARPAPPAQETQPQQPKEAR